MTDDDARKLEAALTPLIHTAQEQVVIMMMDTRQKNTTTHYCGFLSITILSPDKIPNGKTATIMTMIMRMIMRMVNFTMRMVNFTIYSGMGRNN